MLSLNQGLRVRDWPIGVRGKIRGQEDVLHGGLGEASVLQWGV
jgi:hypothetical protein